MGIEGGIFDLILAKLSPLRIAFEKILYYLRGRVVPNRLIDLGEKIFFPAQEFLADKFVRIMNGECLYFRSP
ncbi:MAG: hypothetical protein IPH06_11265 [Alphaproteobacteria bacterium]|nr:hypothetical protein [Alphaproteobacteria bacterium]QQS56061.1 MAG: hypothetical protein IPN28_07020 [Alphaproteobacteria bacterium]